MAGETTAKAGKKPTTDVPLVTAGMSDKELIALLNQYIVDKGGQELSLERLLWKPESCGEFPVIGHIINCVDMPPADRKDNPDWKAFIVRLTQPTKVTSREGDVTFQQADSEVVVPANYQLAANLARFALDPEFMHEISIQAKKRVDIGGGKKMWTFKVHKMPEGSIARTGVYLLPAKVTEQLNAAPASNDGQTQDASSAA